MDTTLYKNAENPYVLAETSWLDSDGKLSARRQVKLEDIVTSSLDRLYYEQVDSSKTWTLFFPAVGKDFEECQQKMIEDYIISYTSHKSIQANISFFNNIEKALERIYLAPCSPLDTDLTCEEEKIIFSNALSAVECLKELKKALPTVSFPKPVVGGTPDGRIGLDFIDVNGETIITVGLNEYTVSRKGSLDENYNEVSVTTQDNALFSYLLGVYSNPCVPN